MKDVKEFWTSLENCPLCGSKLVKLYNKRVRRVITLKGDLYALERVKRCGNPECKARNWAFFSEELSKVVIPRKLYGMDVVQEVARLKYEEHLTHREIQRKLLKSRLKVSLGEITYLLRAFEALVRGWQELHVPEIRKALETRGGYILSVDATFTLRGKRLYIFRDALSGLVLLAGVTPGDTYEDVKPLFQELIRKYGLPVAVVSDMQSCIGTAVKVLMPGVKHQYCQYHFLKGAGRFMASEKDALKREINSMKTKAKVEKAVKGVKKGRRRRS